jgi:hypothetical protein
MAFVALLPALAQADQLPKPITDYTSRWSEDGPFVLYYHGALKDGTACPASPNALQWSMSDGDKAPEYFHGFSIDQQADPAMRAAFEVGTFCSIVFEGNAAFTLNWGKFARLLPEHVSARDPAETN